jgi:hypothetical protein
MRFCIPRLPSFSEESALVREGRVSAFSLLE